LSRYTGIRMARLTIEQALKNPPRLPEPDWPSPHPYERLVVGEILAQEMWNGTDGLGVLSLITGDLPAPPLARFCGIAPVEAETDRITWKWHGHRRHGADHPPGRDGFRSGGPQSVFPAPGFTRRA